MTQRALAPATFADYRAIAKKRLPRQLFDFIDGGAYQEVTLRDNAADLDRLRIRQRVLRDVSRIDTSADLFGMKAAMPLALAPVGLAGMFRRRGEAQAVRAANAANVPFCLSTVGVCGIEEVAAAASTPFWFQLYVMRDRGVARELLQRAAAVGCTTLALTVDLAYPGARYRDVRSGFGGGLDKWGDLAVLFDRARRFAWLRDVAIGGRPHAPGNLARYLPDNATLPQFSAFAAQNLDPSVSWKDVEWIRGEWKGAVLLKGVLDAEDARRAVDAGVQGVIVSNHGGRQLDSARSSIGALPSVIDAVEGRIEVLMDGGVRSGLDVVKAVATGAKACLIGRAWVWPLAAQGEAGVTRMLAFMKKEIEIAMALAGLTNIGEITRAALDRPDI